LHTEWKIIIIIIIMMVDKIKATSTSQQGETIDAEHLAKWGGENLLPRAAYFSLVRVHAA
jgi:hypothetical protein